MTEHYRLSGGGNDFLALVEPAAAPARARIRAWCARGLSAGADGLFLLGRSPTGARMTHFNADGGRADLCVNGVRCAARLAFELGWAGDRIEIVTDAGAIGAERTGADLVRLELPPLVREAEETGLELAGRSIRGWRVRVGVPHFVIVQSGSLRDAPVASLGPPLRAHPDLGEAGTNVDWVRFPARDRLEIRSFERGVEAETLACGTGVLAAAAVGLELGRLEPPIEALTRGGFRFRVDRFAGPEGEVRWHLTGDARIISRGELLPGAEVLPESPDWD